MRPVVPFFLAALLAGCAPGAIDLREGSGRQPIVIDPQSRSALPPTQSAAGREATVNVTRFGRRLNAVRQAHNLADLAPNAALSRAAALHASNMERRNYFAHYTPEGASPGDRATESGYRWGFISENIGTSLGGSRAAIAAWMTSPSHRGTILSPRATEFGIGRHDDTWVLLVATPR